MPADTITQQDLDDVLARHAMMRDRMAMQQDLEQRLSTGTDLVRQHLPWLLDRFAGGADQLHPGMLNGVLGNTAWSPLGAPRALMPVLSMRSLIAQDRVPFDRAQVPAWARFVLAYQHVLVV